MPLFDLFGIGKPGSKDAPAPVASSGPQPAQRSKHFWRALLAADALVLIACLGFAGVTLLSYSGEKSPSTKSAKAGKKARKGKKKEPSTSEEKKTAAAAGEKAPEKPAEKKAEPEKTAAKEPAKKEPVKTAANPKGPTGSPAVHAPDLPERHSAPQPTKPEAKPAEAAPKPDVKPAAKPARTTRPITLDYADPEAKKVSLVGMFLISTGGSKQMFKNGMGVWKTTVYLNIGYSYRYQFEVIDKQGGKKLTPVATVDVF